MAEFLNEQEQVDALKTFWRQYGRWLLMLAIVVAIGMVMWQVWQNHRQTEITKASVVYERLLGDVSRQDNQAITSDAQNLMQHYKHTPYASMAALFLSSVNVNQQDLGAAQENLNWVIKNAKTPAFKATATLRLARILVAQGQADQALQLLQKPAKAYEGAYAIVMGDAYVSQGQFKEAAQSYQFAIDNLPPGDYMASLVKLKLSNLPSEAIHS